jgi:hypothetical protein
VAAVTAWCAVAYLPLVFGWSLNGYNGVLAKSFWGPPLTLLLAVALLVAYLQYALFLAPLGLLVATGIAPRSRKGRYRLMQITIVCALVGCIAVALGADFIVAGVCIHD